MQEDKIKIREFLSQYFRNHDLSDDEDFFALGFLNSMFAMQLVMFVESTFGITIDNEDLEIENFATISAIARLVERKRESLANAG